MQKNWFKIENKVEKSKAEIFIYDEIGEGFDDSAISAKKFVEELKNLGDGILDIDLHINSPGGNVFSGLAIYNVLKAHKARITVYIDGIAASIASVVAMAGDIIKMPENSIMMIHDPAGMTLGPATEMKKMAEVLDKLKNSLITAYRDKTGLTVEKISELMEAETWFSANEAVAMGFADEMIAPSNVTAKLSDLQKMGFKNIPNQLTSTANPLLAEAYRRRVAAGLDPEPQESTNEVNPLIADAQRRAKEAKNV